MAATFERYREFIKRISPTVLSSGWGEKLQGTLAGLVWDMLAGGATEAARSPWLSLGLDQPTDALPPIGDERNLFRYLDETDEQWQERLQNAWEIWDRGGSEVELLAQLTAAGYELEIHSPVDWTRTPLDWESQFWVLLTDAVPFGAGFNAGQGALAGQHNCGVSGDPRHIAQIRNIVATFRAGHTICRQIIIRISGTICGTTGLAGSHTCGGHAAYIGTGIVPT